MIRQLQTRTWIATGVLVACAAMWGCQKGEQETPALATVSVTLDHDKVPLGSPLHITYKFVVAPDAKFDQDYRVFAHVKDADGERIWDDDHNPPTPTTQWKPGQTVEYTRTVFVPMFPYIGEATLELGLHSTADQSRLTLNAENVGQHAYRVARFELQPATENLYTVYKDGWNQVETSQQNSFDEWQWTKKDAVLAFKNPKKDAVLYFDGDAAGSPFESQQVQVLLGTQVVDQFTLAANQRILRRIALPAAAMGDEDMPELHFVVDKTFVPAQVNPNASRDIRVLGVRVFHAYVDGR